MKKTRRDWIKTLRLCEKAAKECDHYGFRYFAKQYESLIKRIEKKLDANPDATTLKVNIKPDELSGLIGYRPKNLSC